MGFFARRLGPSSLATLARLLVIVPLALVPATALAQGAFVLPPPGAAPGAPATGGGAATAPTDGAAGAAKAPTSSGNIGGVSFNDKPAVRRAPVAHVVRSSGPLATFPGFEQLPDGGSRLFVQLSQSVPVEERRAPGSVTYVLKGAHLRVHNDANALVTVHFNTPVYRARLAPQGNDLLFILELRSAAAPTFKVASNPDKTTTLQIDFPKGDFVSGDGSEALPPAQPPRALGRVKGAKGPKGAAPAPAQPPPAASDDTGPNP